MQLPTFSDVSLSLALTAIVIMITAELSSPHYGQTNLLINRKRLRNVALIAGILFLTTVAVRIYTLITSP